MIKKAFKHFKLVCKHKYYVFIECKRLGIPWQGIKHDLSKFSSSEFITSVKYYTGDKSPIDNEKKDKGYSYAWLHHRGRNPHHWEYWIDDLSSGGIELKIPYNYVLEMICDWISAGKTYLGDKYTISQPYEFFTEKYNKGLIRLHPETYKLIREILLRYSNSNPHLLNAICRTVRNELKYD